MSQTAKTLQIECEQFCAVRLALKSGLIVWCDLNDGVTRLRVHAAEPIGHNGLTFKVKTCFGWIQPKRTYYYANN